MKSMKSMKEVSQLYVEDFSGQDLKLLVDHGILNEF